MNLGDVFSNLGLFAIGIIWMLVHVLILLVVGKLIKAPLFYVAVGSQANVGGAASAPIVASAFSPTLAPVGVLMAVLGYAMGTYGAIICAMLMQSIAT
jgi:Predicted integral membrane protein